MSRRGPVVVVDLDSTLCNTLHRRGLAPEGEARSTLAGWKPYSLACYQDEPIKGTIHLVRLLHGPNLIFLLSARHAAAKVDTEDWLWAHDVPYDQLRLRGEDESEPAQPSAWKITVLNDWKKQGWDVQLFIDDWAETCLAVTNMTGIPTVTPTFLDGGYQAGH